MEQHDQPIRTPDELLFSISCIEGAAMRNGLSGTDAYNRLSGANIINGYIIPFFDVLHTQGREYVTRDISELMRRERVLS